MFKLVFAFWKLRNSQLLWNSENLLLFCLDESFYSRPYSGYLFSNCPNIHGDSEDSDLTPTTAIAVRIRSLIFYNYHSDEEDKVVTRGLNYKLVEINPSPEIFQVLRGHPCSSLIDDP